MRSFVLPMLLCCLAGPALAIGPTSFQEPNAILINITEADLNRIVRDAFEANTGSRIQGVESQLSRDLYDFYFEAGFSTPTLTLGQQGAARLDLSIVDADLRIGRIDKKLRKRTMSCENTAIKVAPQRPVGVSLAMRFALIDGGLHIVPDGVTLEDAEAFRLKRPSRCRNNPLPEWIIWRLAKGRLRRKIGGLDELLLDKARSGADELNGPGGLLADYFSLTEDIEVYPQTIDTSRGSLLIGFSGAGAAASGGAEHPPAWSGELSDRTFVGLSESFVNSVLQAEFEGIRDTPREMGDSARKLLRSDAIHALIPGLRSVEDRGDLRLRAGYGSAPRIEFDSTEDGRAMIRILLSDAEVAVWEAAEGEPRWLGSVVVESAKIAVMPYYNVLGGISFETLENDWHLSSSGIEFDEETIAATLGELLFGEMFETSYEPVAGDPLRLGKSRFNPRWFSLSGNYLVIDLTER